MINDGNKANIGDLFNSHNDIQLNSGGDLVAGHYIQSFGQTNDLDVGSFTMVRAGAISLIFVVLSEAPGLGSSRLFTINVNGINSGVSILLGDLNTSGSVATLLTFNQYDSIQLLHSIQSGSPAAASARGVLTYH